MPTRPEITEAARFGYGIRPDQPRFAGGLLAQLAGQDPITRRFPVANTRTRFNKLAGLRAARNQGPEALKQARRQFTAQASRDMMQLVARAVANPRGFRERLFAFWHDHFSVSPKRANESYMLAGYFNDAIRPHISGRFSELLKAVITHPSMLIYLDQNASTGPNSAIGQRRNKGLNENLAREVLELHTLGVNGPYTQDDVRQFAELLTGLGIGPKGMRYVRNRAEPGAEQVLGQSYGGGRERLENIYQFLENLALNPATARYLAQKLVVHFLGPQSRPALVVDMAAAYLDSGGELRAFYEVLIAHPAALAANAPKVRPPLEYAITVLRALDFNPQTIVDAPLQDARKLGRQLTAMGQRPFRPSGPDGWPEAAENWITPPQLAARISWVGQVARSYANDRDPRTLLGAVLGDSAPEFLSFAVTGAATKWEGVALLLVSPALMRR